MSIVTSVVTDIPSIQSLGMCAIRWPYYSEDFIIVLRVTEILFYLSVIFALNLQWYAQHFIIRQQHRRSRGLGKLLLTFGPSQLPSC